MPGAIGATRVCARTASGRADGEPRAGRLAHWRVNRGTCALIESRGRRTVRHAGGTPAERRARAAAVTWHVRARVDSPRGDRDRSPPEPSSESARSLLVFIRILT